MLYDIGFFIFSIFYLPTLVFKGKIHRDFLERFGIYSREKEKDLRSGRGKIWIQAVSVGEVALCRTFIPRLNEAYPDKEIVLSTITKTGNSLAKKLFPNGVLIVYFPLDFSFIAKRVAGIIKPEAYIMIETEIWPNLLKALRRLSTPSLVINGRISDRSYGKYRLVRPFLRKALNDVDLFCMQSRLDAERIIALGAGKEKVVVTGSMKFDVCAFSPPLGGAEEMRKKMRIEAGEKLFVAGSIHEGEEEPVLKAFTKLIETCGEYRLLIAPRHIERVREVEASVRRAGFVPARLSFFKTPDTKSVIILDTIGQLKDIYQIADIVYIGGSLVRRGGQNPIEPAIFGKPIIFGRYMFNFRTIASLFLENDGAVQVRGGNELAEAVIRLAGNSEERLRLGSNAKRVVENNAGATERNIDMVRKVLC